MDLNNLILRDKHLYVVSNDIMYCYLYGVKIPIARICDGNLFLIIDMRLRNQLKRIIKKLHSEKIPFMLSTTSLPHRATMGETETIRLLVFSIMRMVGESDCPFFIQFIESGLISIEEFLDSYIKAYTSKDMGIIIEVIHNRIEEQKSYRNNLGGGDNQLRIKFMTDLIRTLKISAILN